MRWLRRLAILLACIAVVVAGSLVWRTSRLATIYGPRRGEVVPALPVPGGGGSDAGAWISAGGLAELVPVLVPLVLAVAVVSILDARRRQRRRRRIAEHLAG